jgi:predicted peroxiredoxin
MSDSSNPKKLVVSLTVNASSDRSTVAMTIANAALSRGMQVGVFLSSEGVELSRQGACDYTHVAPLTKLSELISSFLSNGGVLWSCSPCFNHRGLSTDEVIEGAIVTGAGPMLDWIGEGAQTLSF